MAEFNVNSVIGSLSVQSDWSGHTVALRIWATEHIACSEAPSVCGWNEVNISNLVPSSLCVSCQNLDVNLES